MATPLFVFCLCAVPRALDITGTPLKTALESYNAQGSRFSTPWSGGNGDILGKECRTPAYPDDKGSNADDKE